MMDPGIDRKQRAKQLKTDIPAVFLSLRDGQTPAAAKIMAAITVAYALSPVDLVPDFIPVLGYLDDLILLPGLVALTIKLIPDEVMHRCREAARDLWKEGKPKKWYYSLPIFLIWLILLFVIINWIIKAF